MGVFRYKAVPAEGGRQITGTVNAESPRQARGILRERGLLVTTLKSSGDAQD
ncbi:MAG: hypothetical protein H6R07_3400, partial [Proteobacteria bacterium]|nr:hypothetical protein [Pseudomonadota bacterium]